MKWGKPNGGFIRCLVGLEGRKEQVVPVDLVFFHHYLEHDFEDLVDSLNLSISLRVIRRGILVFKLQQVREFCPNIVLEMRIVVRDQLLGDTEMSDNVVKKETCHSINLTIESMHDFDPFGKVINEHNDVFRSTIQRRVIGHEFNRPFAEGNDYDDGM